MMKLIEIDSRIEALNIQPGMIVEIYGGTETMPVEQWKTNGYGAILISDGVRWYGLGIRETVTVKGYFNPENA